VRDGRSVSLPVATCLSYAAVDLPCWGYSVGCHLDFWTPRPTRCWTT